MDDRSHPKESIFLKDVLIFSFDLFEVDTLESSPAGSPALGSHLSMFETFTANNDGFFFGNYVQTILQQNVLYMMYMHIIFVIT